MPETVKLVVFVPESHADKVRQTLGQIGAGHTGNYSHCSFSIKGTGRFKPLKNTRPHLGKVGQVESVAEERIETVCYKKDLKKIIAAIKKVHPYEEVALHHSTVS
jgi:hypothetical protein